MEEEEEGSLVVEEWEEVWEAWEEEEGWRISSGESGSFNSVRCGEGIGTRTRGWRRVEAGAEVERDVGNCTD